MPTYSSLGPPIRLSRAQVRSLRGFGQAAPPASIPADTALLGIAVAVIGLGVLGGMMAEKHSNLATNPRRRKRARKNKRSKRGSRRSRR